MPPAQNETFRFRLLPRIPCVLFSAAFHVLIITLTTLVTLSIEMPKSEDFTVTCRLSGYSLAPSKRPREKGVSVDEPVLIESTDIVVPPDVVVHAELGDSFETLSPE